MLTGLARPARGAITEAWVQRYNNNLVSNSNDRAVKIVRDVGGDIIVTGITGDGFNQNDRLTIKYSGADGAVLWQQRYNAQTRLQEYGTALTVDCNGNVMVTGSSIYTNSNTDFYTARYAASDGALMWEQRQTNGGSTAVVADASGNAIVTGGVGSDYYTAKYAATNGALLWEQRYNGPANSFDFATAVAVDGNGNVVVTGGSENGLAHEACDYYTAKYAAADGALLWEQRYLGPANKDAAAQAVAVDGSGNVVVTGYSMGDDSLSYNTDYYTAKYAAANGALLWEKRYDGPANNADRAQAVALDRSGNVIVTGYSWGSASSIDHYTAKYAAADGALLWEKRYTNGFVLAVAVAVDDNDNAVVMGTSYNGYDTPDYYTAKYAAAAGALLWEKRYNGPANGNDYAASLALGPNGMVAITGSSSEDFATVVYWENLPPLSIALVPTGVRLRLTGVPGRSYNIERAPAVTGPWTTLATPTAPLSGLIEYVDTNAPAGTVFYRTSAQ